MSFCCLEENKCNFQLCIQLENKTFFRCLQGHGLVFFKVSRDSLIYTRWRSVCVQCLDCDLQLSNFSFCLLSLSHYCPYLFSHILWINKGEKKVPTWEFNNVGNRETNGEETCKEHSSMKIMHSSDKIQLFIFGPTSPCTMIKYISKFTSVCKIFNFSNFQEKLFGATCPIIIAWLPWRTGCDGVNTGWNSRDVSVAGVCNLVFLIIIFLEYFIMFVKWKSFFLYFPFARY